MTFHYTYAQPCYCIGKSRCKDFGLRLHRMQQDRLKNLSSSNAFIRSGQYRPGGTTSKHHKRRKSCTFQRPHLPNPNEVSLTLPSLFTGRNLHSHSLPLRYSPKSLFRGRRFPPSPTWVSSRITTVSGFNGIGFKRH